MPVLLAGLPLAFSRASDAFSIDSWITRKNPTAISDVRNYTWPLKTMQLVFCLVFFAAGIAKLRFGGIEWVTSDTLRNYFYRASIVYADVHEFAHTIGLNRILYEYPTLTKFLAAGAIIGELVAPVALLKRSYARVIVPMLLFMQIFIFFTIFVNFQIYLAMYIAWIDWAWIYDGLKRQIRGAFDRPASA